MSLLAANITLLDVAFQTYLIDYVAFNLTRPKWFREICERHIDAFNFLVCWPLDVIRMKFKI